MTWPFLIISALVLGASIYKVHQGSKVALVFLFFWMFFSASYLLLREESYTIAFLTSDRSLKSVLFFSIVLMLLFLITMFYDDSLTKGRSEIQKLLSQSNKRVDQERVRISRELHDTVNQKLIVAKHRIREILQYGSLTDDVRENIIFLSTLNDEIYNCSRSLVNSIRIEVLDSMGLYQALSGLTEHYSNAINTIVFSLKADKSIVDSIPDDLKVDIYRIVQESLLNAVKHSKAPVITISVVSENNGDIIFYIEDCGVGMDNASADCGIGLIDMKERARAIGADLKIFNTVREKTVSGTTVSGTTVSLRLFKKILKTSRAYQ